MGKTWHQCVHANEPLDTEGVQTSTTRFSNIATMIGLLTMTRPEDEPMYYKVTTWPANKPSPIPLEGVAAWNGSKWEVKPLADYIVSDGGCCGKG